MKLIPGKLYIVTVDMSVNTYSHRADAQTDLWVGDILMYLGMTKDAPRMPHRTGPYYYMFLGPDGNTCGAWGGVTWPDLMNPYLSELKKEGR